MSSVWAIAKKTVGVLLATGTILIAMTWLSGGFRSGQIQPGRVAAASPATAPAAKWVPVVRAQRPQYAELVGSVQAEVRATVTARLVANIIDVTVRAGDAVNKDDILAVLDDRDLKARVGQAKSLLVAATAKRDRAKTELDRIEELARKGSASAHELNQIRETYAEALAEVARVEKAVSEAEVALSDAIVRSPLKGIVIDRHAEPGDQASPGKPLLVVYDPGRLRLEVSVREALVGRLPLKKEIDVYIDALREKRRGVVQEIVPASDPQSHSFVVKVSITDSSRLYPGMFGRVRLPLEPAARLEIPTAAVERVGQLTLVTAKAPDGQVRRRSIRLGQAEGDMVEVLAGLEEGELVLLSPK